MYVGLRYTSICMLDVIYTNILLLYVNRRISGTILFTFHIMMIASAGDRAIAPEQPSPCTRAVVI